MSGRELEMDWSAKATCAFDVVAGEFVVATADGADLKAFAHLTSLLRRVRKAFGVEAVFVCEWAGGEPLVRCHRHEAEHADPLQALFGERLLDAQAPQGHVYRFDAVPIVTNNGLEHGTLCARRAGREGEADDAAYVDALRSVARLIAGWFDEQSLSLSGYMPLAGSSVMGSLPMSVY